MPRLEDALEPGSAQTWPVLVGFLSVHLCHPGEVFPELPLEPFHCLGKGLTAVGGELGPLQRSP
eukprot:4276203-Pyramimonas_sp.AAC.1